MSNAGDAAGDAAVTAKVKTALLADADVKGLQIDVDTRNGVVTLNGTADNQANMTKAQTIARNIDGVKSVENKLTVKP
jgi:hyperosmotically inducible protein